MRILSLRTAWGPALAFLPFLRRPPREPVRVQRKRTVRADMRMPPRLQERLQAGAGPGARFTSYTAPGKAETDVSGAGGPRGSEAGVQPKGPISLKGRKVKLHGVTSIRGCP